MEAMMSFEDMIKEGMEDGSSANPPDVVAPTSSNNNNNNNSNINNAPLGQIPEPTEPSIYESLKKAQKRVLNEALYHSAENGFVDISIDLRNMGKGRTVISHLLLLICMCYSLYICICIFDQRLFKTNTCPFIFFH